MSGPDRENVSDSFINATKRQLVRFGRSQGLSVTRRMTKAEIIDILQESGFDQLSTDVPSSQPSTQPSMSPIKAPTLSPEKAPTLSPMRSPTLFPIKAPTLSPIKAPSKVPSRRPSWYPTLRPTDRPTEREFPDIVDWHGYPTTASIGSIDPFAPQQAKAEPVALDTLTDIQFEHHHAILGMHIGKSQTLIYLFGAIVLASLIGMVSCGFCCNNKKNAAKVFSFQSEDENTREVIL